MAVLGDLGSMSFSLQTLAGITSALISFRYPSVMSSLDLLATPKWWFRAGTCLPIIQIGKPRQGSDRTGSCRQALSEGGFGAQPVFHQTRGQQIRPATRPRK